jgi:PIN domain nuclease of toxin-antitoxin system
VKLLLDTQAFLWFADDHPRLSRKARRRIEDPRHDKFLSLASVWELAIKLSLGKLRLSVPLAEYIETGAVTNGIALLPIEKDHAIAVATLPDHHRDPFDRLLVAQALNEGLTVVGSDERFDAYGVRRVW